MTPIHLNNILAAGFEQGHSSTVISFRKDEEKVLAYLRADNGKWKISIYKKPLLVLKEEGKPNEQTIIDSVEVKSMEDISAQITMGISKA